MLSPVLHVYLWVLPVAYLVICHWLVTSLEIVDTVRSRLRESFVIAAFGVALVLTWPISLVIRHELTPTIPVMALAIVLALAWPIVGLVTLWSLWSTRKPLNHLVVSKP